MNRRLFVKNALAVGVVFPNVATAWGHTASKKDKPRLNAYYLRAHMYTLVPKQVREDMAYMADLGTKRVSVAILEQDLHAAVENVNIIANEANKKGMDLAIVPSRWGGIVAGAPKVPSLFSIKNAHTWMLQENGQPIESAVSGVISSIHYPEVFDFFCESIQKALNLWPVKAVIWDEPKNLKADYSPAAVAKLGPNAPLITHVEASAAFFERVNAFIKNVNPEVDTQLFLFSSYNTEMAAPFARMNDLDYFGCDGRPWREAWGGSIESYNKTLNDKGEMFLALAKQYAKKGLLLIENHNLKKEDIALMEKGLPEVTNMGADELIYYYFPRNVENPEWAMKVIKKHLGRL